MFTDIFNIAHKKHQILAKAVVVPEKSRCVQCGICSYNCPAGIDIRHYSMRGMPVTDSRCLTCGECTLRCPRGALRFELMDPAAEFMRAS